MADGDIQSGGIGGTMSGIGKGVSDISGGISDFVGLFRGNSSSNTNNKNINLSTTTEEDVSPEKATALLQHLLGSINGLASVSSGQKAAGLYDSTTNQQLTNDLLARSTADVAALSKKTTQTQTGDVTDTQNQHKKGALEWIVCTELHKQGKLPHKFYRYGARVFAAHSDKTKQGYYLWAVPAVKHLRKYPNSVLSAILQDVFTARAEYLAAKAGCKDARKTMAGFVTTYGIYAICVILSRTVARNPIDWFNQVYHEGIGGA